jgi:hypothetical protein
MCPCGESRSGNSDSCLLFPGAGRVMSDKWLVSSAWGSNFPHLWNGHKRVHASLTSMSARNCLRFCWELACSSDLEKEGTRDRLTSFLFQPQSWVSEKLVAIGSSGSGPLVHSVIKMRIIKSYLHWSPGHSANIN